MAKIAFRNKATGKISKRNKEMVRLYATDPKMTKNAAYRATHYVGPETKPESVNAQVTTAFNNPLVKSELAKYENLVENTLVDAVSDYGKSEKQWERTLAVDTAKWIHDKIKGKAVTQVVSHSTVVTLGLDLTDVTE